ncbi:MAG: peptidylprolyl isomerase [Candidatus Scalindua sp.]|nr:peptidylprolyl isomerase [Candidatus Scalindua sp.]
MNNRSVIISTIFLTLTVYSMVFPFFVQGDDNIVAEVNKQKLGRDDLADLLIKTYGREGLEQLIRRTLVRQEAERSKVTVAKGEIKKRIDELIDGEIRRQMQKAGLKDDKEFSQELEKAGVTLEKYRENIVQAFRLTNEQVEAELMAEKIIRKTVEVTDDELLEAYEDQYGEKVIARQIVLRTMRDAEKIIDSIKTGVDFEALAKKNSVDRNSASRGGEMRPFGSHGILGHAVKDLKKGEISQIVKTDKGYHILKIENRIPRSMKKFSEVRDELQELVTAIKVQQRVGPWLLNLVETAEIKKYLPDL